MVSPNDVLWETILINFCLVIETLQILKKVLERSCCLDEAYETQSSDSMMLIRVMYKPTVNLDPRELAYIIRKSRNTAWLYDNNRTILVSDGQIAPMPTTTEFKTEPSSDNGTDVTEVP